jgi:hypothetical protein
MIRKSRTFGLAVVSVLAMSALFASLAHANPGTATVAGGGSATYNATQTGAGHTFTLPGNRKMSCSSATFSGSVSDGATTVDATPVYTGCIIEIGVGGEKLPATVNMGSCTYHFTLLTPVGGVWPATTDIVCASGDIHINVYSSHANHTAGVTLCEYTIQPTTGLTGVQFRNASGTTIGINATSVSVPYTKPKGPIGTCGGGSGNAVYVGDTIATGSKGLQIH